MAVLHNPVIRGCNPDPSIVRVGEDYFVATSTFEWFPAVRLHHSSDLVRWRTIGHVFHSADQLELRGIAASGGIWAPSLSHHDGVFWLVYTVVRTTAAPAKDLDNYLVTGPSVSGPWSAPIRLNSRGFDPSLFHDIDGRRWLACIQWDERPGRDAFAGIAVQEYDHAARRLIGESRVVLRDDELIEGPNLYRRDGYYYLLLAEGGTGYNHGVSMARSRSLDGPYELDPQHSLLTSRDDVANPLQKAGHGELVQTADGAWYLVHLASRPTVGPRARFCVAGRETCLQRVAWDRDGWLRLADDDGNPTAGTAPRVAVRTTTSAVSDSPERHHDLLDDFDVPQLDTTVWSTLRRPAGGDWLELSVRPGRVRLTGRQSPASLFDQSMIATRVCEPEVVASTLLEATPRTPRHRCGLVAWYDGSGYYYAFLTVDDAGRRIVVLELGTPSGVAFAEPVLRADDWPAVHLRFTLRGPTLAFDASPDGTVWHRLGTPQPADVVSDDYPGRLRFTGCFAAIRADDHDGDGFTADFDHLQLRY